MGTGGIIGGFVLPGLVSVLLGLTLMGCNPQTTKPDAEDSGGIVASNDVPQEVGKVTSGDQPVSLASLSPLPPDWHPGQEWHWSDGYALKVSHRQGDITTLQRIDDPRQWQKREGLFLVESQSATTHRKLIYRTGNPNKLFPLAAGKNIVFRREYLASGELKVHRTSWAVEGRETIQVPAGEFDCWILMRRTRSLVSDWVGYERWWYSPEVQHYVRLEYQYGPDMAGSRVLMSYVN